jgi:hypothetical protein
VEIPPTENRAKCRIQHEENRMYTAFQSNHDSPIKVRWGDEKNCTEQEDYLPIQCSRDILDPISRNTCTCFVWADAPELIKERTSSARSLSLNSHYFSS